MKLQRFRSSLLTICFLVCTGLALDCEWDQSIDPKEGLDPASLDSGALYLNQVTEVPDPESCKAACCREPDCDLALVLYPADTGPHCLLVRCLVQNQDVCRLRPSDQSRVYRRVSQTVTQRGAEEDGHHAVPLLGSWEPKTNETNNVRCRQPMKVGSCRAAFPKFYYDVTNQSCRSFIYGGCEANGNNFETQEECEVTCSGVTGSVLPDESTPAPPQLRVKAARMAPAFNVSQDVEARVESEAVTEVVHSQQTAVMSADEFAERCGAEPEVGPCRAAFQHWYYNRETGSCQSFIYGGCRGNKNNYITEESCMAACTVTVLPSSEKVAAADGVSAEYKDHCVATPDPGPCRASFPMFYYNPNTATCQSFIYGGCRGNQNRYSSKEECMSRCIGTGSFDSHGSRTRNRWTAAAFLFITLAAISALLLVSLIILTLRRRSLSRRPSSISDKEELLPDPDEQSSVESLTLPESPKPDKA